MATMGLRIFGLLAATALSASVAPARAQDAVAAFYRGRTVQLIIPSSAGGGYDLYGRLVARHIGRFIPGNPSVNPVNMSGAAGVVAAQYTYASAPKDGTVLTELYSNALLDPLTGTGPRATYDPLRFQFIGNLDSDTSICFTRADGPIKSFADAISRDVSFGATGVGSPSSDYPPIYNNLFGAHIRVINGYPGINEIGLAIEKGEMDGTCGSSWSSMVAGHPQWLEKNIMRVIAQENIATNPAVAKLGAPRTIDFAKTDEQRAIMEFAYTRTIFGRPFVMAPETPMDRANAMRAAMSAMIADKDFLADVETSKLEVVGPMTGDQLASEIRKISATPPDIVAKAKAAMTPKR